MIISHALEEEVVNEIDPLSLLHVSLLIFNIVFQQTNTNFLQLIMWDSVVIPKFPFRLRWEGNTINLAGIFKIKMR